jgi:23S rRNA (guanosine2251-2'-O)-methyltransferase
VTRSKNPAAISQDHYVYGRQPVLELLRTTSLPQKVLIAKELAPSGIIGRIRRTAEAASVVVRVVPKGEIDRLAAGGNHQGVLAIAGPYRYAPMEELLARDAPALLFLDGVTDPHNLGSLLRSADGAGFDGIVIPSHRSVGVTAAVRRVASGAAEVVPVARVTNLGRAIDEAREAGLWVVGLDEDADEELWSTPLTQRPVGLVLGAEGGGISRHIRGRCDGLARIPTRGRLASLNVAVAGAVAMFEIARRDNVAGTLPPTRSIDD